MKLFFNTFLENVNIHLTSAAEAGQVPDLALPFHQKVELKE